MTNSVNANFLGFGVHSRRCQLPRILVRNYEHYVNLGRLDCIDGLDRGRQYVLKRFNILANIDGIRHREFAAHCNFILNPCTITNQAGICTQANLNKCTLCKFYVQKILFETFLAACRSLSIQLVKSNMSPSRKSKEDTKKPAPPRNVTSQWSVNEKLTLLAEVEKRPFIKVTSLFSFPSVATNSLKK